MKEECKMGINMRNTSLYVFNKVFTGKYLQYNLGHEIINFIIADDKKRYIYINPLGNKCRKNPQYVFHVIKTNCEKAGQRYELVAVSEIDDGSNIQEVTPTFFNGKKYNSIFNDSKPKNCVSYVAKNFYIPRKPILFKFKGQKSEIVEDNEYIDITLKCNPQHHIGYCEGEDNTIIAKLFEKDRYLESNNNYNVSLEEIPSELPFAVLSGRVGLELSMSNLIAYFIMRDKRFCTVIVNDFLDIQNCKQETFIIRREEHNIDILLEGENTVIVIENKIHSGINGKTKSSNDNCVETQLSKYYDYVQKKYSSKERHFYILAPGFNIINKVEINKYKNGTKYKIKSYRDLYDKIKTYNYMPDEKEPTMEQRYLFDQFIKTVEYLSWSTAKQMENTAYIRLKQKL